MSRRVFFSFHYRDLWRVQIVRNSGAAESVAIAGFQDAACWEAMVRRGEAAIRESIDRQLEGTSVTAVLIGAETANRDWIAYEIERSLAQGNGIFGIRIHLLKDRNGLIDLAGPIPDQLKKMGAPVYTWEYGKLGGWIDDAVRRATNAKQ